MVARRQRGARGMIMKQYRLIYRVRNDRKQHIVILPAENSFDAVSALLHLKGLAFRDLLTIKSQPQYANTDN